MIISSIYGLNLERRIFDNILYFFGPCILLSTLFSNPLSLCSSLNVRSQVSHPYGTTGKIIGLYILIFTFLGRDEKIKGPELNGSKHFPDSVSS
jgi:hypothetical protein